MPRWRKLTNEIRLSSRKKVPQCRKMQAFIRALTWKSKEGRNAAPEGAAGITYTRRLEDAAFWGLTETRPRVGDPKREKRLETVCACCYSHPRLFTEQLKHRLSLLFFHSLIFLLPSPRLSLFNLLHVE
jgi:hypothetical protein